jgi:hypothetical protein
MTEPPVPARTGRIGAGIMAPSLPDSGAGSTSGANPRRTTYVVSVSRFCTVESRTGEDACRILRARFEKKKLEVVGEVVDVRANESGMPILEVYFYSRPSKTATHSPLDVGCRVPLLRFTDTTPYVVHVSGYEMRTADSRAEAVKAVRALHPGRVVRAIGEVVGKYPVPGPGQPVFGIRQCSGPSDVLTLCRSADASSRSA